MEGTNFGSLSGFRTQTGSVAKATFVWSLAEAAASGKGSAGRAPTLHRVPWHLPYNWGKSRKTSVRVTEKCSADLRRTRFVWSTWPSRAMASTDLLDSCRPWGPSQANALGGEIVGVFIHEKVWLKNSLGLSKGVV